MTERPGLTDDAFLGGQLQILQPEKGYRAAVDAVCLAAAMKVEPGAKVLDVGAGVGTVSLCLARRLGGLKILGLEKDPEVVTLARENAARNGLEAVEFVEADLFAAPAEIPRNSFDLVMTNPPYYRQGHGRASPDAYRRGAHMPEGEEGLEDWLTASLKFVRPLGSFAVVFPAEQMPRLLAHLSGPLGNLQINPLWPGEGKPAKRVIVTGVKGAKGESRLHAGLVLHEEGRRYSVAAEIILRDGAALDY